MLNPERDYVAEGYLSDSQKAGLMKVNGEYYDPVTLNFLGDLEKIANSGKYILPSN